MVSTVCSECALIPSTLSSCVSHMPANRSFLARYSNAPRLTPPRGLELTKVAFCLNTLSLSGVKNKACQSLTACREKDINYSRQRVERSCLEWEVFLLSCHLPCVTSRAGLWLSHRAEVGPNTCETAGQEEPVKGFHCWFRHVHWYQLPCLHSQPQHSLMQGHRLRGEERAVVAATREEAIQGPKTRFIAKGWGFSYRGKKCIIRDQADSRVSRKWHPIFLQDVWKEDWAAKGRWRSKY